MPLGRISHYKERDTWQNLSWRSLLLYILIDYINFFFFHSFFFFFVLFSFLLFFLFLFLQLSTDEQSKFFFFSSHFSLKIKIFLGKKTRKNYFISLSLIATQPHQNSKNYISNNMICFPIKHFQIKIITFNELTIHFPVFFIHKITHQTPTKPHQKKFPTKVPKHQRRRRTPHAHQS